MTIDEGMVYEKLEGLAVSQATIIAKQEAEARARARENERVIVRLDASNGTVAKLRRDFDQKALDDARDDGRRDGILRAIQVIMGLTFAVIAAAGTISGIIFAIARLL